MAELTFWACDGGFVSRSLGGTDASPAYTIASAAVDRVAPGVLDLPEGTTSESLAQAKQNLVAVGEEIHVDVRQAQELAYLGGQLVDLETAYISPWLEYHEREGIKDMVLLVE